MDHPRIQRYALVRNRTHHSSLMVEGLSLYLSEWKTQWFLYSAVFVVAVSAAVIADLQMILPQAAVVAFTISLAVTLVFIVPIGLATLTNHPKRTARALPNLYLESIQLLRDLQDVQRASINVSRLAAELSSYIDHLDANLSSSTLQKVNFQELLPRIDSFVTNEEWQLIWYRWAEQMDLEEIASLTGRPQDQIAYDTSRATAKVRRWVTALRAQENIPHEASRTEHDVSIRRSSRTFQKRTVNLAVDEYVSHLTSLL